MVLCMGQHRRLHRLQRPRFFWPLLRWAEPIFVREQERIGLMRLPCNGTGIVEAEIRHFLASGDDDSAVLARAIRRHWSVENMLHWVLDVTFCEDDSRVRDRTAARDLALLREIALNLVAGDRDGRV